MEVAKLGARTRARAAFAMEEVATAPSPSPSPKRRKINKNSFAQGIQFSSSSFGEDTLLPPPAEERCAFSPASDESPAASCSSNGSVDLDDERIKFIDLESSEAETSMCNCSDEIRREPSILSENGTNLQEVESILEKSTKANSGCFVSTQMKIMPMELELEEFFAAAEKEIQKRFSDKYNYDIVKDVALEGRYEWVLLNP